MVKLLIPVLLIFTAGCAHTTACPPLYEYDEAFNQQLADELEALPESATAIPEVVADYIATRDALKKCQPLVSESTPAPLQQPGDTLQTVWL